MGLEYIELAMAIEEEFGVAVLDEEITTFTTVQSVVDIALQKTRLNSGAPVDDAVVISMILQWISDTTGIPIVEIKPEDNLFEDLGLG